MNLQNFIKESVVQIAESIVDIQQHFDEKEIDAIINPREFQDNTGSDFSGRYKPYARNKETGNSYDAQYFRLVDSIEFDVAITVETNSSIDVGGKLKVFGASIGAEGDQSNKHENVSKLKFKIPLVLPHGKENKS